MFLLKSDPIKVRHGRIVKYTDHSYYTIFDFGINSREVISAELERLLNLTLALSLTLFKRGLSRFA